jgi:peptidoglycan/LPS O-acetylase OafA/YrhL
VNIQTNDLFTNLDYFSVGAYLAFFFIQKGRIFIPYSFWSKRLIQVISLVVLLLLLIFQHTYMPSSSIWLFLFRPTWIAFLFALIIALFICPNSKIFVNIRILDYLGQRSFGLYVFHIIVIHMGYQYCLNHQISINNTPTLLWFIGYAFVTSAMLSMLSYRFFELPFLRLRERLT